MMAMIEKTIVTFLMLGVVPFLLGNRISVLNNEHISYKIDYAFGWLFMLAIFEIIVVPETFLKRSLSEVSWIYSIVLVVLVITFSIFINKTQRKYKPKKLNYKHISINCYGILAVILLLVQLVIALFGVHMDADDAYYVGTATTSLSTDTLFLVQPDKGFLYNGLPLRYAFSALMIFWAYLSKVTGMHPLIITHTIIPIIFIILSYLLWWEIGNHLFNSMEKKWIYFLFLNVMNIYGNTSVYTQSSFLLFRIWQGKAMLPNIILPAILIAFFNIYDTPRKKNKWILVFIIILAACCCSSMAVPMGIIVVITLSLLLALIYKDWKLVIYGSWCSIPCFVIGILYILA